MYISALFYNKLTPNIVLDTITITNYKDMNYNETIEFLNRISIIFNKLFN